MFIPIVIIAVLAFMLVSIYNGLIKKKNSVESSFSGIDVMLKKRYDLIPNLVEVVKTFMNHEKDLLIEVTALRAQAMSPNTSTDDKVQLNNQISKTMGGIMVAVEAYPDLKSNVNFLKLQGSWETIENEISGARTFYNSTVLTLNNAIEMFPSNIVAGFMKLYPRAFFETEESEKQNISAKELFGN
ncbi:MAG: LemA protein [Planctomycetota bacterium]|jgi:LemA protein